MPTEPTPVAGTPAAFQGTPGWSTVAAGEPAAGVFIELHMPTTDVVAGALVTPEFQVRNMCNDEVSLSSRVIVIPDGQKQTSNSGQAEPRAFPTFPMTGPPGALETRVPAGQTRAAMAMAQVPFDASRPVHLHAGAVLGNVTSNALMSNPVASVQADIPLHLMALISGQFLVE